MAKDDRQSASGVLRRRRTEIAADVRSNVIVLGLVGQHEASHCSGRAVQIVEQRSRAYSGSLAPEMH
jgi:hypothetical protein